MSRGGSVVTEADWLTSEEPQTLIEFISQGTSERKCRLLAAALCRHVLPLVSHECAHRALDIAEEYADGRTTVDEMRAARERVFDAYCTFPIPAPVNTEPPMALKAASIALQSTMFAVSDFDHYLVSCCICTEKACTRQWMLHARPDEVCPPFAARMSWQRTLIRDIFGNPFRPSAFSPAWRTEAVVALASSIYAQRAFDHLAVLADALEEAGCGDANLLAHCRSGGPHVRGCWVVDMVLGVE
jgi:hypothetical protein